MGYTHLEPGQECEIVERVYSCDGNSDISALVQLSTAELDELAQDSMEKEKAIYAEALAIVARWKQQAYETVAYRKAQAYLRTLPVTHTSNQWVKGEYDWHEISNMVYKFIWRSYENSRWDSKQKKSVPVSWELSWYLTYNTPREPDFTGSGRQIAGQERKRFGEKATMEKYLQGRINAYAHLFKEISPPIPAEHEKRFCVNGVLLPGYTVEAPKRTPQEVADELLGFLEDEDASPSAANANQPPHKKPPPHKHRSSTPTR